MKLKITDPSTGEYPDIDVLGKTEEWAKHIDYATFEGFCLSELCLEVIFYVEHEGLHLEKVPENRFKVEVIE